MQMITFFSILLLIFVAYTFCRYLINRKWRLIYTAFGYEKYFCIVSALKTEGIKFKTNTPIGGIRNREFINHDFTQYDIYVKKEEEQRAINALKKMY
jgi:hypothetical protein